MTFLTTFTNVNSDSDYEFEVVQRGGEATTFINKKYLVGSILGG